MSYRARLARLEKRVAPEADRRESAEAFARRFPKAAALLVSNDLMIEALVCRLEVGDYFARQIFAWLCRPYATWAVEPARYELPAALLEFLADPKRDRWGWTFGCEGCGLLLPRLTGMADEAQPFRQCPACGGRASQRGCFGPPGSKEYADGPK